MTWQMPLRNTPLLAQFEVAHEVLPVARGIEQEAPSVARSQRVHLLAGENQPVSISRLGDAGLNLGIRQPMLAQCGAAQAEKVVGARRNSTATIEIITHALRK